MAPSTVSALGMALNGKSASVDIPKPRDSLASRDNFTAVPANTKHRGDLLLTPPNSVSPNLHPRERRGSRTASSDVDLQDVPEEPQTSAFNAEALDSLGDLDSAGAITPGLLAKHHLPDILLSHGPLAIRHIMGYLTTSVPGFSRITSPKARRLVVAALEGRGSGVDGGGLTGDVLFEKVGWGRWDARLKGQPPRDRPASAITPPGSLPSSYSHQGFQVPGQSSQHSGSERLGTSMAADSAVFSHSEVEDEDHEMMDVDKMSMDANDEAYASSEAPEPIDEDMGEGDETDEEDWEGIGAEALRARSLPKPAQMPPGGRLYQPISSYSVAPRYRSITPHNMSKSMPSKPIPVKRSTNPTSLRKGAGLESSSERAAIEALLSLGTM